MRAAQARLIIGARMRELRTVSGNSLRTSATMSGWDKGHLSRVERGSIRPSRQLVEWYDATFGAGGALLRQYHDLQTAVRADRERAMRDARRSRVGCAGSPASPAEQVRFVANGSVPADFDPADRSLLVTEDPPRGALVQPGELFEKSWTIRNGGPVPWRGRYMTRQGAPGVAGWLDSATRIAIPDADPDAQLTVSVRLRAPESAGASIAYFKITDGAGRLYYPTADSVPLECTVIIPHRAEIMHRNIG